MGKGFGKLCWILCLSLSAVVAVLAVVDVLDGWASESAKSVKLIEWGWNTPTPAYVKGHIREMEKVAFDGLVLDLSANEALGRTGEAARFGWNLWTSRVVNPNEYSDSYEALRTTEFRRFTENFLRFNVTPGDVDWFGEEMSSVLANAALAARIARSCGLKGILLDVEHYHGKPFDYSHQRERSRYRFEDYQARARQFGGDFIRAVNRVFPDITILLTYGYHLARYRGGPPEKEPYGLLPSFLDGMLEAASRDTSIIDGWEYSYGYKTEDQFKAGRDTIYREIGARTGLPEAARRRYRCSFGLWVDHGRVWGASPFHENYFTPQTFTASLRHAMKHSDRYVWVYSQRAHWWNGQMPAPYLDSLTRARSPEEP